MESSRDLLLFYLFTFLLFQQLVNAVNIVQRVVDEEAQLGHDAQLIANALTQSIANLLAVLLNVLKQLLALLRRENAEVGGADAEVGRDLCSGYRHHHTMHSAGLLLENHAQLFLQQACNLILSCFLHNKSIGHVHTVQIITFRMQR